MSLSSILSESPQNDGERLVHDLQALVPVLRERSQQAEDNGRIPEATIDDLKRINAFKAVVPERFGGMEVEFPIIPHIFRLMGRGCMSTACCLS